MERFPAEEYNALFQDIRSAFNKTFVSPEGNIKGNTQTCYTLALSFDLLTEDKRDYAAQKLVKDIKNRNWHLSTGFIGTPLLLPTLTRIGRTDVAYRLLLNKTYPSWGYTIKHGATTIWERWDGWTDEKGFQDPYMNSFNHYAFGSVCEWMYSTILGIETRDPGFRNIIIKPQPGGGITHVKGSYYSVNGIIAVEWKLKDRLFVLHITIPPNTTALVQIPSEEVTEPVIKDKDHESNRGTTSVETKTGNTIFSIQSGAYHFKAMM